MLFRRDYSAHGESHWKMSNKYSFSFMKKEHVHNALLLRLRLNTA